jgi:hypothetical protein
MMNQGVAPGHLRSHANPIDPSLAKSSAMCPKAVKAFVKLGSSFWWIAGAALLIAAACETPPFNTGVDGYPADLEGGGGNNRTNEILRLVGSVCLLAGAFHRILDDHLRRTMVKHDHNVAGYASGYAPQQNNAGFPVYTGAPNAHLRAPMTVRAMEWIRRVGSYIQFIGTILLVVGTAGALAHGANRFDDGRRWVALWVAGFGVLALGMMVKILSEALAFIRYHFHAEHKQDRQTFSLVGTLITFPGILAFLVGSILYLINERPIYRAANILWIAGGAATVVGQLIKHVGDAKYYSAPRNNIAAKHAPYQAQGMQHGAHHNAAPQMVLAA